MIVSLIKSLVLEQWAYRKENRETKIMPISFEKKIFCPSFSILCVTFEYFLKGNFLIISFFCIDKIAELQA